MKVLVVEDEHKIANSIKRGLEQEGYVVDVAYDGLEGYDLASSEEHDVIILDLMLPEMDGLTIVKKLRDEKNHTKVLVLTAKGQVEEKVEGLNSGADDYLVKPFAFTELVARVKALGRRPRETLNPVLSVDGLTLNTLTYEAKRDGKDITLTHREFSLLEYFMRHQGKILNKDQIISNVWSYDDDILPNTVEVFIGYLRNKIDRPFKGKKDLIHTIRGFGYKLG